MKVQIIQDKQFGVNIAQCEIEIQSISSDIDLGFALVCNDLDTYRNAKQLLIENNIASSIRTTTTFMTFYEFFFPKGTTITLNTDESYNP